MAAGRLVPRRCAHPARWVRSLGVERCPLCGTERHTAYATLRKPLPDRAPGPAYNWGCPPPRRTRRAAGARSVGRKAHAKTPPSVRETAGRPRDGTGPGCPP
ncbi:DUF6255 family natural product biosynthesis protein [Streptomyces roseoverticillatus]|uniref:DUF6255 family natural product biosynthesis protein n=1 Tax=Streptomyces roseoverticillatus TaxID=66429 RepID=UPI0033F5568C